MGKSVDSVSDIEKRRSVDCPTSQSVLNVTYSVVFHEEYFSWSSAEPMWTILLDLDIHPLALDSLTGFMFQYKSLVSLVFISWITNWILYLKYKLNVQIYRLLYKTSNKFNAICSIYSWSFKEIIIFVESRYVPDFRSGYKIFFLSFCFL